MFAFFGMNEGPWWPSMTVKLPTSHPLALAQPGVEAAGYGLGRAGWVTVKLSESELPFDALAEWVRESYRAVAPKRLAAELASAQDPGPA